MFLVGNGPSLAATPLDLLIGEKSFSCNWIYPIFEKTAWRPTFYFAATAALRHRGTHARARAVAELGIPSFVYVKWISIFEGCPHVYPIFAPKANPVWSEDCTKIVGRYSTAMFSMIQMAAWMGFQKIYLLGCDMDWKPTGDDGLDKNHFDPRCWDGLPKRDEMQVARDNAFMADALRLAKDNCDRRGIEIYNATLGGKLEVFPRVGLEEVLSAQ